MRLSVVVPAFNEERRWPSTWKQLRPALLALGGDFEVIVVDDGSSDDTAGVVARLAEEDPRLKLLKLPANRGRGVAVRQGVMAAAGDLVLEGDADGSVDPEAIGRFVALLDRRPEVDVAIASRNVSGSIIAVQQPWLRVALGYVFLYLSKALFDATIADYTLGFKLFRRDAARDVFSRQANAGFMAEAELVVLAQRRGWRVWELPVRWSEYGDSRVKPLRDSWRSSLGLARLACDDWAGRLGEGAASKSYGGAVRELKRLYAGLGPAAWALRLQLWSDPCRRLEALVPREGVVVQLGSGYGVFANLLAVLSPRREVHGVEPDGSKAAAAERGAPNARFRCGPLLAAEVPAADAVVLLHALRRLTSRAEQESLLAKCAKRLAPGGRLVVCEVDPGHPAKGWWSRLWGRLTEGGRPLLYLPPQQLQAMLERAGFAVETWSLDEGRPSAAVAYLCLRR